MADATSKSEFDAALKQSNRDRETSSGKRYARQFEDKVFLAVTSKAMQTCLSRSRDTRAARKAVSIKPPRFQRKRATIERDSSRLEPSSALNEVNDQDDGGNYEQEMDQTAANVADEA
jgi:hypothetical protein